jgi:hypothetical protein
VFRVRVPRDFKNQKFGELVHHIYTFRDLGVLVFGLGDSQPHPGPHTQGANPHPGPTDMNAVVGGGGGGGGEYPRQHVGAGDTEVPVRVILHPGANSQKYSIC